MKFRGILTVKISNNKVKKTYALIPRVEKTVYLSRNFKQLAVGMYIGICLGNVTQNLIKTDKQR